MWSVAKYYAIPLTSFESVSMQGRYNNKQIKQKSEHSTTKCSGQWLTHNKISFEREHGVLKNAHVVAEETYVLLYFAQLLRSSSHIVFFLGSKTDSSTCSLALCLCMCVCANTANRAIRTHPSHIYVTYKEQKSFILANYKCFYTGNAKQAAFTHEYYHFCSFIYFDWFGD